MKKIENKTKRMIKIEQDKGVAIEEILRELFVDKNKSTASIAEELSISYVTAFRWLKKAGIYSRRLDI